MNASPNDPGTGPAATAVGSAAAAELTAEVLDFIGRDGCADAEFDRLALRLHAYQYLASEPYRRFCLRRGATPRAVRRWQDIPATPIDAFKTLELACQPPSDADRVFMTSGTTRGNLKGRHRHATLAVYDRSMTTNFARRFMRGDERLPMAILFPSEVDLPHSSLAHYLALARANFGTADSGVFVGSQGLDSHALIAALTGAERSGRAFALLGATATVTQFLVELARQGRSFRLPAGSRVLDTGGSKGMANAMPADAFYDALSGRLGIDRDRCINMYGMTELSTQFYDDGSAVLPAVKSGPHWIRSRLVDPIGGAEVARGERGILVHCDLANVNSVTTLLTEDVGVAVDGGFLLLGRAEGAQAAGCSLAVDEFVMAASA